nr:zinc-binding dehydrogenase [Edaphobacter lichenicola]
MGAQVVLFTSSEEKTTEAARLGAAVVLDEDLEEEETLRAHKASLDFMLSTIPEKTDLNPFIPLLKRNASLVVVGALEPLSSMNNMEIAGHRRSVGGSLIGSIAETQEVLDLCAEHNVGPAIQIIDMKDINDAYDKVENKEVRFRYVIDISSLKNSLAV